MGIFKKSIDLGSLVLENIECVDADSKVFEHYDKLEVAKDVFRKDDGSQMNFTPYNGAVYCEEQGLFLPSFALSCNIVAALYANRTNRDAKRVLQQYKDRGNGYGWYAQNTVVNWKDRQIVHYPIDSDFPSAGGTQQVNSAKQRNGLGFDVKKFGNVPLEQALQNQSYARFIKNLIGLRDPSILVEVGQHFGKPAYVLVPGDAAKCKDTRAAWLGCDVTYFSFSCGNVLGGSSAVRGVRRSEP